MGIRLWGQGGDGGDGGYESVSRLWGSGGYESEAVMGTRW